MSKAATRRPRAFGRTSNVWQYVETVQERSTPKTEHRSRRLSQASGFDENDEGSEFDPWELGTGTESRRAGLQTKLLDPVPSRGSVVGGGVSLKPTRSLAELPNGGGGGAGHANAPWKRGSAMSLASANSSSNNNGATSPTTSTTAAATSAARKVYVPVSGHEVIRRIQNLGTSASAPTLANPPSPQSHGQGVQPSAGNARELLGPASPQATMANTTATAAAAAITTQLPPPTSSATGAAIVTDAERLQNDFNSQTSRLYYGCSVALELFNGQLLVVSGPDGHVGIESLDKMHLRTPAPSAISGNASNATTTAAATMTTSSTPVTSLSGRHRPIFTLIDLTDVRSANAIRYGDAVWLQLSVGLGEGSWEQGGVLGAKVREAPQLKALALADDSTIRNDALAPLVVGHPVPVKAYLPKNRDDADAQADEIQSRVRNKSSKMLGKWIIRAALPHARKPSDNYVYNNDEVYLEQDWFYLGADSDAGQAVLRQLPPTTPGPKDVKPGEYVIERRAAWRIRLLDSSNGGAGLTLAQQQMERLLLRAKNQLKQSRRMRAGQTRSPAPGIQGGSLFVGQLRAQLAVATRGCDTMYLGEQARRLARLPAHLGQRAEAMNALEPDPAMHVPTAFAGSSGHEAPTVPGFLAPAAVDKASNGRDGAAGALVAAAGHEDEAEQETERHTDAHGGDSDCCGLCQAASVGYNLCGQSHEVMDRLHVDMEQHHGALVLATQRLSSRQHQHQHHSHSHANSGCCSNNSNNGSSSSSIAPLIHGTGGSHRNGDSSSSSSSRLPVGDAATNSSPAVATASQRRVAELLAAQDRHLVEVIKIKEKAVKAALAAQEHARVGLSPVAAQFRDRFKHLQELTAAHDEAHGAPVEHHGIGGHFQRLHQELRREETVRRQSLRLSLSDDEQRRLGALAESEDAVEGRDEDDEDPALEGETMADGESRPAASSRMFPTEREMEQLPPIDTAVVLALYLQNKAAVVEMLDGYADLVETHIRPNLAAAMNARNRGALVEFLDFSARASEFVCARRVQVRVAELLHAIAETDVGDTGGFQGAFDRLLVEFDATLAFVRFYRDKVGKKAAKKRQS